MNNVLVATYRYRHEGEHARGFLADGGIRGVLAVDSTARQHARDESVKLFVHAADAERARTMLTDDYDLTLG